MYSNTLTLSTDLRFNLNPNFRMSLKSFRYPSNSTSFRSPQFTKMPGTGGTGAYGDVSDGGVQGMWLYMSNGSSYQLTFKRNAKFTVSAHNVDGFLRFQLDLDSQHICNICSNEYPESLMCCPWKDGGYDKRWYTDVIRNYGTWVEAKAGQKLKVYIIYVQQGSRSGRLELAFMGKPSSILTAGQGASVVKWDMKQEEMIGKDVPLP